MSNIVVIFLISGAALIPVGLLCLLQYFLARMDSPWPGRVLPILSGIHSLMLALVLLLNLISWSAVWVVLLLFVLLNIPTALFVVIYRTTRRKELHKRQMDRMNIQDLE